MEASGGLTYPLKQDMPRSSDLVLFLNGLAIFHRRRLRVASGATAPGPALQAYGRPFEFVKHTNRDTDTLAPRGHGWL
jgi:hypothetical protein